VGSRAVSRDDFQTVLLGFIIGQLLFLTYVVTR
jgi:hypothetical protein